MTDAVSLQLIASLATVATSLVTAYVVIRTHANVQKIEVATNSLQAIALKAAEAKGVLGEKNRAAEEAASNVKAVEDSKKGEIPPGIKT